MLDDDMAAAFRAIPAFADVAAFKPAKEFLAFGDVHILFLPQCERAHRRGGITPAVFTMAVTHLQRFAAHLDLYRATVTLTSMLFGHRLFDMVQIRQGSTRFCCSLTEVSVVSATVHCGKYVEIDRDKFASRRRRNVG